MSNIITVKGMTKKYLTYRRGSGFKESLKSFFHREKVTVYAVKDVSFAIEKGDIVGILGPNGAGKSTSIKMLTGSLYPSEGEIEVMGFSPAKERTAYVKEMGAVFGQKSQLIWDIPPVDSFRMNKAIYGISDQDFNERLDRLTEIFEIKDIVMRPTRVLSLGERMKCEFIMAMLHRPKIVFLDEPTIGLDVISKQKIRDFILEMNQLGTTFILTTHDLEDVEQLARKVIIINKGEKVFDDTIENLRTVLGMKKIVEITFSKPVKEEDIKLDINGIKIISLKDEVNCTIELDLNVISISDFIRELTNTVEFSDISIKELPMETIITHIYKE